MYMYVHIRIPAYMHVHIYMPSLIQHISSSKGYALQARLCAHREQESAGGRTTKSALAAACLALFAFFILCNNYILQTITYCKQLHTVNNYIL